MYLIVYLRCRPTSHRPDPARPSTQSTPNEVGEEEITLENYTLYRTIIVITNARNMKRSDPLLLALLLLFVLWRDGRNDDGAVMCRRPVIPHNMTHQGKSEPSQSSTVDCAGRGRDFWAMTTTGV